MPFITLKKCKKCKRHFDKDKIFDGYCPKCLSKVKMKGFDKKKIKPMTIDEIDKVFLFPCTYIF